MLRIISSIKLYVLNFIPLEIRRYPLLYKDIQNLNINVLRDPTDSPMILNLECFSLYHLHPSLRDAPMST